MASSCEKGSATHLCTGVSSLRGPCFQGSCDLFLLGKRFSLCSQQFHPGQRNACPCGRGKVTWWPLSSHSASSVLEQPKGLIIKTAGAFSPISHQNNSSPHFFCPGKVAATRVTFNDPSWQVDRKGRLKIKIKNKSKIPSIPKGAGGGSVRRCGVWEVGITFAWPFLPPELLHCSLLLSFILDRSANHRASICGLESPP